MSLTITIPGEPVAQGRPRAFVNRAGQARVYDPAKSRNWKATAQQHMADALRASGGTAPLVADGAVELHVIAVFTCPRSHWRKRDPIPRRPKDGRPDAENVAKAVQDAASGVLFTDDAQVARLVVEKWVGAQGEAPGVTITVHALEAEHTASGGALFAQRAYNAEALMPEPAPLTEPTAREKIHAALDAHLDFAEANRTEGRMLIEIPLAGGKPRRFEVQTVDRRHVPNQRGLTPRA